MGVGGIRIRGAEVAGHGCTVFSGADTDHFRGRLVVGTRDRQGDRGRFTGVVAGAGIVHRFIGKRDLAGFARGQVLEVTARVEAEGAIVVIGHRTFSRLGQDIEGMGVGGIRIRGAEAAGHRCTIFRRTDAHHFRCRLVVGTGDRQGNRGRFTGVITGTGIVHRFIGKRDLTGFARCQVLEVTARIEAEGAIVVIGHRPFSRLGQDIEGMGVGGIRIRGAEAAGHRCTVFGGADTHHFCGRLVVGTGDRQGNRGRFTGVITGTGIVHRFIGKRDLTGFARCQVLEVTARIEAEGAIVVIGHRAFSGLSQDIEGMGVSGIRIRGAEAAGHRCTIFSGTDTHHFRGRLVVGTGDRQGNRGRFTGVITWFRNRHRLIGKRDLAGFARGSWKSLPGLKLKVPSSTIGSPSAVSRLPVNDIKGMTEVGGIRIRSAEAAGHRCTVFGGADTHHFRYRLVVGTRDRQGSDCGRFTGVIAGTGSSTAS